MSIHMPAMIVLACTLAHAASTTLAADPAQTPANSPAPIPATATTANATTKPEASTGNAGTDHKETLAESLAKMPEWTVLIEASAQRLGASGKVRMPGSSALASPPGQSSMVLQDVGADAAQWAPYGRLRWRPNQGRWSIGISSVGTKIDEQGRAKEDQRVGDMLILTNDSITSKITFVDADIEGGYRIYESARGIGEGGATRLSPYVDLIGGVRIIDTDVEFRQVPATVTTPAPGQRFSASNHDVFVHPIVGARAGIEVVEKFNIDLKFTAGGLPGNHESFTWDIEPCFTWRPYKNVGVHIGYRNLCMNLRDGKDNERYSWNGTMAGVYFGLTCRF